MTDKKKHEGGYQPLEKGYQPKNPGWGQDGYRPDKPKTEPKSPPKKP